MQWSEIGWSEDREHKKRKAKEEQMKLLVLAHGAHHNALLGAVAPNAAPHRSSSAVTGATRATTVPRRQSRDTSATLAPWHQTWCRGAHHSAHMVPWRQSCIISRTRR
ncbi:hypothetical protein Scep_026614 [Stephania cephalantha]|uniref:Uncharacterized protein n=1 Tax=Stephania cephalantha TaxID=152367 RepID=A0AAP0HTG7_9MAGN